MSLEAGDEQGIVETVLLRTKGSTLFINGDASAGRIAVEVLDAYGHPVPGYAFADYEPISGDDVHRQVRWKGRASLPAVMPVRLRFLFRHARLYSFSVER